VAAGPHSGDDTFDLIDDALYQLAERRGKWLGDPLAAITLIASLIDQAERMIPEHVLIALDDDATWHDIATALATSPEQAELRYSPDSPVADSRWPTTGNASARSCVLTSALGLVHRHRVVQVPGGPSRGGKERLVPAVPGLVLGVRQRGRPSRR
jgi:hypothetical protein